MNDIIQSDFILISIYYQHSSIYNSMNFLVESIFKEIKKIGFHYNSLTYKFDRILKQV